MSYPGGAAIALGAVFAASLALAQGGPRMVPFGGTSEMKNRLEVRPEAFQDGADRLLSPEEFSDALTVVSRLPLEEPLLTDEEIEYILTELAGFMAGEIASGAIVSGFGGGVFGMFRRGSFSDLAARQAQGRIGSAVVGDRARELASDYFRTWWRDRAARRSLAIVMATAGVRPDNVRLDREAAYRGAPGYMDIWVELLEITRQQHLIAQVRENHASLPDRWLENEIARVKAIRRNVYLAAGLAPPDRDDTGTAGDVADPAEGADLPELFDLHRKSRQ